VRYMYGGVLLILYFVLCFVLVICLVVSYTYCIVFFVLSSLCVWWCPIHIVFVFCFVLVMCMVVSYTYCIVFFVLSSLCVWWCPTHIVLCFLFCLQQIERKRPLPNTHTHLSKTIAIQIRN
jgi:hypothetical protein